MHAILDPRQGVHHHLNRRYTRICAVTFVVSLMAHLTYLQLAPAPEARPVRLAAPPPPEVYPWDPDWEPLPPPPDAVAPPTRLDPRDVALIPVDVDEDRPALEPTVEPTPLPPAAAIRAASARGTAEPFVAFVEQPVALHQVRAEYPSIARLSGATGRVVVEVTIDEIGRVRDARVVESDTVPSLEKAALVAARQWLFRPARQRDRAVAAHVRLPFVFELR